MFLTNSVQYRQEDRSSNLYNYFIPYLIASVKLKLPAASGVKLSCLSCLIPSDPSSPSDRDSGEGRWERRKDGGGGRQRDVVITATLWKQTETHYSCMQKLRHDNLQLNEFFKIFSTVF